MSLNLTPDYAVLSRFRNGDEEAFRTIYEKYYHRVYWFAFSFLKNKEQSEEILQETFLNTWTNRKKLDDTLPLEPYLFTVCKRLVLDAFRKATSTSKLRATMLARIEEMHNTTEDNIIFSDLMKFTENAISSLPKQQQTIFRLSRFEGLSYEEIAKQLNISKHTVKNHLVAALKTIKDQFEHQGILYSLFILLYFR